MKLLLQTYVIIFLATGFTSCKLASEDSLTLQLMGVWDYKDSPGQQFEFTKDHKAYIYFEGNVIAELNYTLREEIAPNNIMHTIIEFQDVADGMSFSSEINAMDTNYLVLESKEGFGDKLLYLTRAIKK